jgi:regulator of cell morphogenesis and NO signaling
MTILSEGKTVREIALENPASVAVFEALGIDYCCGGNRDFRAACAKAQVSEARVWELIEDGGRRSDPQVDWTRVALGRLIAHITGSHHEFVRHEAPRIDALLAKVVARHGAAHHAVVEIQRHFAALTDELLTHMVKEERVLFPYIQELEASEARPPACFGSVAMPIAMMRHEHEEAGVLLSMIRALSNGFVPPEGACPTFRALYRALAEFEKDLHQHVHLENNILFPRAEELESRVPAH